MRPRLGQNRLFENITKRTKTIEKNTTRLSDPKLRSVVRKELPEATELIESAQMTLQLSQADVEKRQAQFEKGLVAALAAVDRIKRQLPDT